MPTYLCRACGTQYPPSDEPPGACPICEDPRQYIPHDTGQAWLTLDELRDEHEADIREDHGILGIGCTPRFAIGQRALLVKSNAGNVLWDCTRIPRRRDRRARLGRGRAGGDRHLASALLHDDGRMGARVRVPDPDPRVRPEVGAPARPGDSPVGRRDARPRRRADADPLRRPLRRRAGAALARPARAAHRRHRARDPGSPLRRLHVLVPERDPAAGLEGAGDRRGRSSRIAFDTIHGAWWGNVVEADGSGVVRRSVDRYVRAVTDPGLAS